MQKLKNLGASLLASVIAAVGMLPLSAQAIIHMPKQEIICGPSCIAAKNRFEQELMYAFAEMAMYLDNAYANDMRTQWGDMYDDVIYLAALSLDARCNPAVAAVTAGVNASSPLPAQKAAAEQAFTAMKNGMTTTQFNTWIAGLPRSSGVTANGTSFPSTTKIGTVIWANGQQTNFTMQQGGSGWGIGQVIDTAPGSASVVCPA